MGYYYAEVITGGIHRPVESTIHVFDWDMKRQYNAFVKNRNNAYAITYKGATEVLKHYGGEVVLHGDADMPRGW